MKRKLFLIGLILLPTFGKANALVISGEEKSKITSVSETETTEVDENVVVKYSVDKYLVAHDEEAEDSNANAIYKTSENGTEKIVELNSGYTDNIYVGDGYIIYTDIQENDENLDRYIVKFSLDTKEKEFLQIGNINFVDTENEEIYYTVFDINEDASYKSDVFKMDTNGENIVELAIGNYSFIEKVDDIIYLQDGITVNNVLDNKIILFSVNTDGTDFKTVLETTEGAYLLDPKDIKEFNDVYLDYEEQSIIDFGVYKDTIYLSIGGYEGSGHFYFGGLVKVGTDGQGFEPVFEDVENFDIIDKNMYFYTYDAKTGNGGISEFNLDTSELTFLGEEMRNVEAIENSDLYVEYRTNTNTDTDNGIITNNLSKYNSKTGEIVTIHEGETVPVQEDSDYIGYSDVEVVGDYVYFNVYIHGYKEMLDGWRGHICYEGYYRVKKDGSDLELISQNPNQYCPKE